MRAGWKHESIGGQDYLEGAHFVIERGTRRMVGAWGQPGCKSRREELPRYESGSRRLGASGGAACPGAM